MSRLAKRPVLIPSGVDIQMKGNTISFKGPKGTISREFPQGLSIEKNESQLMISMASDELEKPLLGLYYSLVKNAVEGVSKGFEKKLLLIGVGYRANLKGTHVELQLGFSHPFSLVIPQGVHVAIEKNTAITITGADKQAVGQFAADIRAIKKPEPYKGKGVRYSDEVVIIKETKKK
jgi:large subunit ribosomal protein L6